MTKLAEIIDFLEKKAPAGTAEAWDNVGLLADAGNKETDTVCVALDATAAAIDFAAKMGAKLLVTHHPVIFHPLKRLSPYTPAVAALTKGVSVLSLHTNLDKAAGGVNDTLAALVSCLVSADLCVTLSDIDGLYTANPHEDPTAEFVPVVHKIDAKIIASAGDSSTSVGTGGMITKIRASRILMTAGIQSVICSGEEPDALVRLARGESVGTLFDPPAERLDIAPRKLWIALGDKAHGSVTVDDGAAKALISRGSSLLAVGIREVDGTFAEGDVLDVCDPSGMVVARGIAEADSDVLELAAGRRQDQIAGNRLLADLAEKPAIHRDNLIVFA